MGKIVTMFLIMVSLGLVFAGSVSAEPSVETVVIDENDVLVTVANPGDEVSVGVYVNADDTGLIQPYVNLVIDPETGLEIDVENARMITDGTNWIYNNDPLWGGFFFWYEPDQAFVWDIHMITGDMDPFEEAALEVPAMVTGTGEITVEADLFEHQQAGDVWVDEGSYTFLSVSPGPQPGPVNGATVPMQATGAPLAVAALGLLTLICGAFYSKL